MNNPFCFVFMHINSLDAYLNEIQQQNMGASYTGSGAYNAYPTDTPYAGFDDPYFSEQQRDRDGTGNSYGYMDGNIDLEGLSRDPLDERDAEIDAEKKSLEDNMSEMSEILLHREKEFLSFLCEPLEEIEESVAEECIEVLADQLRGRVIFFYRIAFCLFYI